MARHRTSRSQPPATDSARRSRSGLPAPLWKVVALSAARGCDDQVQTTSIRGGAPARATRTRAGTRGRRLSEEITVPASDQQSHSPRRGDLGEELARPALAQPSPGTTLISTG